MQAAHQESQSLLHSNESPTSQSQKTLSGPDSDCASVNDDPRIVMNEQGYAQPRPALPIILSALKLRINIIQYFNLRLCSTSYSILLQVRILIRSVRIINPLTTTRATFRT